jgi:hypothetical protein
MFDTNLDSAKCYLKELERQATASRILRELPPPKVRMERSSQGKGVDSLVRSYSRLAARAFSTAVKGAVAAVF